MNRLDSYSCPTPDSSPVTRPDSSRTATAAMAASARSICPSTMSATSRSSVPTRTPLVTTSGDQRQPDLPTEQPSQVDQVLRVPLVVTPAQLRREAERPDLLGLRPLGQCQAQVAPLPVPGRLVAHERELVPARDAE
jgi:hypothetical protein